jgi:lactate dehydrogenase-like 2-hydroxyacid dehydrogenase
VKGQTIGIIGYGALGTYIAKILKNALGMKVIGLKKNPKECSVES